MVRQATATPRRATIVRYVLSLGLVATVFAVIPQTPIDGPIAGAIALASVVVCCWFSGLGPALMMPLTIWAVSRAPWVEPVKPLIPTAREFMTFVGLSMLTGSVGLAGQYRRSLRTTTRRHDVRMRKQARALSLARIVFRDLDGRIETWSEGAHELYGWSDEDATGRAIHELLRTQFPVPMEEIRATLLSSGQWQGEVTQVHQDGHELRVTTHCILYPGEDGKPAGVAEIHSDVTELRRAEAAIREADRRKDLFVATLAHELRNPLAPMRSGLDLLQMTMPAASDDMAVVEIMQRQLQHIVRMVDDLLDVSRINTGKIELRRAPVALAEIVRNAVDSCRPQFEAARQELTVALPEEPVMLHADAARLVQVLMNLLGNASKFSKAGGRIRLMAAHDGAQVQIRIIDEGAGIPPAALKSIFEMFAQVDDPHTRTRDGLGIGLSIVLTMVEMHGGTVEARSEGTGKGSEFIVHLPALAAASSDARDRPYMPQSTNGSPAARRVLVVDDNRDAARTLSLMLGKVGFDCRSEFDGPSALNAAGEFDPHAIILDIGMPGMDGLEVARRLRSGSAARSALLIAVTGWDKDEDRKFTREAGFDHHFAKPVELKSLQDVLGEA